MDQFIIDSHLELILNELLNYKQQNQELIRAFVTQLRALKNHYGRPIKDHILHSYFLQGIDNDPHVVVGL